MRGVARAGKIPSTHWHWWKRKHLVFQILVTFTFWTRTLCGLLPGDGRSAR